MKLWRPGDDDETDEGYVACPNGLILPTDVAEKQYLAKRDRVTAVDLFCGCGGFSLGMIQAGLEIVAAVEWEEAAACTYMCNLCRYGTFTLHFIDDIDRARLERYLAKGYTGRKKKTLRGTEFVAEAWTAGSGWITHEPATTVGCTNFIFGDITKLTGKRLLQMIGMERGDIGCVAGSPPCQGFSVAGNRDINDSRNNLVMEWVRLVLELRPKTCVMENVPGIVSMTTPDGLPIMDVIARALEDESFTTIEMLRKVMALQTGNVGILRSRPSQKKKKAKRKAARPKSVTAEAA